MKFISKSLEETQKIAKEISLSLKTNILLLEGDLGSGKTTFTQALARELGVRENLTSPTFVLMKSYATKHSIFKKLIHIDAYRLNSAQDLLGLGWEELSANPNNLIVVEWPEKVADLWSDTEHKLNFKFIDDQTREISD